MKKLSLLFVVLLNGCSVAGSVDVLKLQPSKSIPVLETRLERLKLTSSADAADNESIGAFNWGSYSAEDQSILRDSLIETIRAHPVKEKSDSYEITVYIHQYSQVITNQSYASLVIVDWVLHRNDEIIVDEVFYAGLETELNIFTGKSLGWAKEQTNSAVISRIANRALEFATTGLVRDVYSNENVYFNPESIVAALPKTMRSTGGAGVTPSMIVVISASQDETRFSEKTSYRKIDWQNVLKTGGHER